MAGSVGKLTLSVASGMALWTFADGVQLSEKARNELSGLDRVKLGYLRGCKNSCLFCKSLRTVRVKIPGRRQLMSNLLSIVIASNFRDNPVAQPDSSHTL